MKIGELARRTGLTTHTIRYYEQIGLIPRALRDRSGQRDYDRSILAWIDFLERLKATGMPIREMIRYARLREQGPATNAERCELLERHRDSVRAHVTELEASLLVLDSKIAGYAGEDNKPKRMTTHEPDAQPQRKPLHAGRTRAG
jgi:DNA-binding transcriptional MerR regulator